MSSKAKKQRTRSLVLLITAMFIYGTIGVFRRYIPLSSGVLAFTRGILGSAFLFLLLKLRRQVFDFSGAKKVLFPLIFSGALIGFNWIALFEAYRYTSVATATLCYYMAPVLIILISPILFREKLTGRKMICALTSLIGVVFVSGVPENGVPQAGELKGILFGLTAAVLYASVIILNKKITGVGVYEKTILQLFSAAVTLLPYLLLTEDFSSVSFTVPSALLLIFLGIVHTGIAYAFYFGSVEHLNAQTVALLSYIDPVTAIVLSTVVLHEPMALSGMIGIVLILGSTIFSELEHHS